MRPRRDGSAVLITEAATSYEDEFAARKRKYLTMTLIRLPCLAAAGVIHETWWLAIGLMLLSFPLPWIAVLMANDRPPRKTEDVNRYQRSTRTIETRDHPVIEG